MIVGSGRTSYIAETMIGLVCYIVAGGADHRSVVTTSILLLVSDGIGCSTVPVLYICRVLDVDMMIPKNGLGERG